MVGEGRERFRYTELDKARSFKFGGSTDGATFHLTQFPDGSRQHQYVVMIERWRQSSFFGPVIDFAYPYEYWLAQGAIADVTPIEDGLQRITIALAGGSGKVLIDFEPGKDNVARKVQFFDQTGELKKAYKSDDLQQFDGIWFPQRATEVTYGKVEGRQTVTDERTHVLRNVVLNIEMTGAEFGLNVPPDSYVQDMRQLPPATYETPPLPESEAPKVEGPQLPTPP